MSGRYVVETVEMGVFPVTRTLLMPVHGYNGKIIVFCYGGSLTFSRYKTIPFLELFVDAGWGAVTFDYYGMGVGWLEKKIKEETGLFTRVRDTKAVVEHTRKTYNPEELVVMGHGMGCPIAIHAVAERQDVDACILSAPAAYARKVMEQDITFQNWEPQFSEGSWRDSEVFGILENISRCHIIRYRGDAIVTKTLGDISAAYFNHAARSGLQMSTIDGGRHRLFGDFPDTFAIEQKVATMLLEWLGKVEWDCTEEEAMAVQEICRLTE
ncbi:MAG: hypothetical protein A3J55_01220 [Candidatus Ryanbacteria bacterium RIFCSPHIGHO2_02_FULL_45_17b]|uniref:Serine aminopeptidase S33 domain-containing protein n=1 Tax=Candidatus Ryanbacteria bacterium RIFCSPHIGHO2_01_FULL_45_22 TaxID=1802114 RepID=A0A1G2G134_9BACT|nr:MAG: hypothetical protein A2719_03690 [Candidatus Ryanbacteria bacterium RIFCSPHIGHO2_01_FULL_45_22]OGZ47155.1 MAG: hypothetical protein A3J55_01220 [Candidatus Ryanbacteria bacterium RIFCSPHIGHO2_02_FULL_45_17b]